MYILHLALKTRKATNSARTQLIYMQAGLKATSHGESVIETSDGVVEIRFTLDARVKSVLKSVLHNELDAWLLSQHALLRDDDGQLVVSLRLPQKGDYALKLFADVDEPLSDDDAELRNVCNYLVRCLDTDTGVPPYPKLHEGEISCGVCAWIDCPCYLAVDKIEFHAGPFSAKHPRDVLARIRADTHDLLRAYSRGFHEDATRKTASWNLSYSLHKLK